LLTRLRLGRAGPRRGQLPLARVAGQFAGPLELGAGLPWPPQLHQEVAADAGQQVVAAQGGFGGELVDQVEAGLGPERHGHGDGPVQLDDR
jgi:hypothetical protein